MRGLDSGHAKIIRGMKKHESIEDCIAEYRSRHPYRKIAQPNGNPTLEITEQPPIEISIICGEIIYQLRSALDHIFFDLVERNYPGVLPDDIREKCHFPLMSNPPGDPLRRPPIPRTFFGKAIPCCIPDEAFTLIESLQPYNRVHGGHELLRMLRVFSNIDKHRHLNATVAAIDRHHIIRGQGGITSTLIIPGLQSGAELYEPLHSHPMDSVNIDKSAMEVEDQYIVEVAFDEPEFGPFQTSPIEDVVYHLPTWVFNISLHFKKFLK